MDYELTVIVRLFSPNGILDDVCEENDLKLKIHANMDFRPLGLAETQVKCSLT